MKGFITHFLLSLVMLVLSWNSAVGQPLPAPEGASVPVISDGSGDSIFGDLLGVVGSLMRSSQPLGLGQRSSQDEVFAAPQPPRDFAEFNSQNYGERIVNPWLFAIGVGLNPFLLYRKQNGLTPWDVYKALLREGLEGRFLHALDYHDAVLSGRTDWMNWMHPLGNSTVPEWPTLYYMAQIQPVNWIAMASVMDDLGRLVGEIRSNNPNDARLQQLALFDMWLIFGTPNWDDLAVAYTVSESTDHRVPEVSNRVIAVADSCGEEVDAVNDLIERQMLQLDCGRCFSKYEMLSLKVNPETSHVFAAALGVNPNSLAGRGADGTLPTALVINASVDARHYITWRNIAIAVHVTGQVSLLKDVPQTSDYLARYGSILVTPPVSNTTYLAVRQQVHRLLERMIELDKQRPLETVDSRQVAGNLQRKSPSDALADLGECSVCLDSEACVVFLPCGHLTCCELCSILVRGCPKCRARIQTQQKVYKN